MCLSEVVQRQRQHSAIGATIFQQFEAAILEDRRVIICQLSQKV